MASKDNNLDLRIERYICGDMCEEEAIEFEDEFISDQACIDQLELTQKFYSGLAHLAAQEPLLMTSQKHAANTPWYASTVPAWSLAATFVLMLLPAIWVFQSEPTTQEVYSGPVNVVSFSLATIRSPGVPPKQVKFDESQIVLSAYANPDVQLGRYEQYNLVISEPESGKEVIAVTGIKPNQDRMLYFNLGARKMITGSYYYDVFGQNNKKTKELVANGILQLNN
jgi:hypothetical protein